MGEPGLAQVAHPYAAVPAGARGALVGGVRPAAVDGRSAPAPNDGFHVFDAPAPNDGFHVFDTTLRDGAQREGINLTVADKLAIARHLDDFGVGFI
ncbi:hypothetical protein ABZ842_32625, partial [Streptomyces sp. NPDC047315]